MAVFIVLYDSMYLIQLRCHVCLYKPRRDAVDANILTDSVNSTTQSMLLPHLASHLSRQRPRKPNDSCSDEVNAGYPHQASITTDKTDQPALVAPYTVCPADPLMPATLAMVMMTPLRAGTIHRSAALLVSIVPVRFVLIW